MDPVREIILASTSPRRKELLKILGLDFFAVGSPFVEDMTLPMAPKDLVKHLARGKAAAVAATYRKEIVIGADTIVVLGKKVLGKPHTPSAAKKMLTALSGKVHSVMTGYCLIDSADGREIIKAVETKVYFKKITNSEINNYIATGEPLDRAGAYAIQGLASLFVKKIEGDFLNVVGLPLNELAQDLKKFGIKIL